MILKLSQSPQEMITLLFNIFPLLNQPQKLTYLELIANLLSLKIYKTALLDNESAVEELFSDFISSNDQITFQYYGQLFYNLVYKDTSVLKLFTEELLYSKIMFVLREIELQKISDNNLFAKNLQICLKTFIKSGTKYTCTVHTYINSYKKILCRKFIFSSYSVQHDQAIEAFFVLPLY